ncbi:MAG TPA: hypothetical protein VGO67_01410 [Verrucomicrobiae bacterium]|jgi:hypothetical protein
MGFVAGVAISAFRSEANSIVITQDPYSHTIAGEFEAATSDNFIANYVSEATLDGNFLTFCVQSDIFVAPGVPHTYVLANQDSAGRQLSEGAAFLYSLFATGQLTDYNYANVNVPRVISPGKARPAERANLKFDVQLSRSEDDGELQAAIWAFQGGQSLPGFPDLETDPFYLLALDTLGANANNPNDNLYNVEILQMWDDTTPLQNQLVYLGVVPDATTTGGMLLVAFGGLTFVARRFISRNPGKR